MPVPHKGCVDRTGSAPVVSRSFNDMNGAAAYYIPRVCQGVYELRDQTSGKITAMVEFENGAVFVSVDGMTIGIK